MKNYIGKFFKRQTIKGWCDEYGFDEVDTIKLFHYDAVVSQHYWEKHLLPTFYKAFYEANK